MALLDTFKGLMLAIARPAPKIARAQMDEEFAPAGAIYDRPPFEGNLAYGMRPDRLGSILRAADGGSSREWLILAEEIEELFPHYQAVLSKRRRQVCQLPITVEDAGDSAEQKAHGDLVRDWVDTGVLQRALFDALDAVGKSFSVLEINWDTTPAHFWPSNLIYRRTSWFEVNWLDGEQIMLRDSAGFTTLPEHKFLVHRHPSKSGGLLRSGLTRTVAWLWMWQTYTLRDWALFCQAYGLPIRVGRYGPEASDNDKRVLWRAVSSIAGNVGAIIPKSMELEFAKGGDKTGDTKLYVERAEFLNAEVSKLVLGSTEGTQSTAGGFSAGRAHRQVEEDVERFDAGLLSTSITIQIVRPMIDFTFGPPADGKYPTVRIGRPDEVPLQVLGPLVTGLAAAGMKFKASEIYDRLQLTMPEGDDEVFGGPPAPENATEQKDVPPVTVRPSMALVATQAQTRWLGQLIAAHAQAKPDLIEMMSERLAAEAAHALGGMTDRVRAQFEAAENMHDLAQRLGKLELNPDEFADAMTRGIALAELVGQAALVQQIHEAR